MANTIRIKHGNNYELEVTTDDINELPAMVDRAVKKFLSGFQTTYSKEGF
ncbi:hypothetical protein [Nitrososphaera viennensis]|uniref:Uncharacterized protein n=2 Tax=Nitrososphaera viennensis TaxID=1034015 RepID=A0A060HMZ2_9ARCH|nr:hypothetical protein [Nitrososphaera viennensis]AIC16530.1 hypothetical protein NVIE_022690 [Nitrososphaera viennensis EN76]UVS68463.1 hypothetical protein NWT39_11195 [Nitrososphaera viennensis]